MLIEPTETKSPGDPRWLGALEAIAREAHEEPATVTSAVRTPPVERLDEATAAYRPNLRWWPMTGREMPTPTCDDPLGWLRS